MSKTSIILGAGPGLGISIARLYGTRGYNVALVARRREPLEARVAELAADGIAAAAFPGDLYRAENVPAILDAVRARFGGIDVLYHGLVPNGFFTPASKLDLATVRDNCELFLTSLVAAVNSVLPEMSGRRDGRILVGLGGAATGGIPFMSGAVPAMAAARNYLQSLHGEVAGEGIRVAMITISAFIKNSAAYQAIASGEFNLDVPPGRQVPGADPAELAERLVEAADRGDVERSSRHVESLRPPIGRTREGPSASLTVQGSAIGCCSRGHQRNRTFQSRTPAMKGSIAVLFSRL
jgi:NAD(P)-dependent dehydrogenase (short-subunit alcohol dehydrogenase family)